jgi:hypothetical protein
VQVGSQCPRTWPVHDPPISSATVQRLMREVVSLLGAARLVTPDTLRGPYATLHDALRTRGPAHFWPDSASLRGKFLVIGGGILQLPRPCHLAPAAVLASGCVACAPACRCTCWLLLRLSDMAPCAGMGKELQELYGHNLEGSPAFTRFYIDATTAVGPPNNTVFAEMDGPGVSPQLSALQAQGLFSIVRTDASRDAAGARAHYAAAVAAGVNLLVTEFLSPWHPSGHTVQLPFGMKEFCPISRNHMSGAPPALQEASRAQVTPADRPREVSAAVGRRLALAVLSATAITACMF